MCAREAEPSELDQPGRREAEQTKGGEAKLASPAPVPGVASVAH